MKKVISSLVMFAIVGAGSLVFAEQAQTKEVAISVSDVYVPGGFSQDTDAYVIISGMFPNSCYRWSRAEVNNVSPTFHEVRSIASVAQTMCLMVLVPYSKEVKLGRLQAGEHTLRFLNGDGTYFEKQLVVE